MPLACIVSKRYSVSSPVEKALIKSIQEALMVSPSFSLPIFLPRFLHFTSNTPLTFCYQSWLTRNKTSQRQTEGYSLKYNCVFGKHDYAKKTSLKGRDLWRKKMHFHKNVHYSLTFFFFKFSASQNK